MVESPLDDAAVRRALDAVIAPGGQGLIAAGLVGGISVTGNRITVALEVDASMVAAFGTRTSAGRDPAEGPARRIPGRRDAVG